MKELPSMSQNVMKQKHINRNARLLNNNWEEWSHRLSKMGKKRKKSLTIMKGNYKKLIRCLVISNRNCRLKNKKYNNYNNR